MNIETIISIIGGSAPEFVEKLYRYMKEEKLDKDDVVIILTAQMLEKQNKILECIQQVHEDTAILKTRNRR